MGAAGEIGIARPRSAEPRWASFHGDSRFLDELWPSQAFGGEELPKLFRLARDDFRVSEFAA